MRALAARTHRVTGSGPSVNLRARRVHDGRRGFVVTALAGLGLALAACNTEGDNGLADDEGTPPAEATGQVADCVIGDWVSAGVDGQIGGVAGEGTISGGAGVFVTVNPDGSARLDFSGMEPLTFDGQLAEVDVRGEFTYAGTANGTVRTDVDTTSGGWSVDEPADWSDVRVTLETTEPVQGRPLDDTSIGEVVEQADEVTGGVVDVDPILSDGTFDCRNDTLVLSSSGEAGLTWTLERA